MSKRYVRMNFEGTQTAKTSCICRSNNPGIDFTELVMPKGQPVAAGRYLHSTLSWTFCGFLFHLWKCQQTGCSHHPSTHQHLGARRWVHRRPSWSTTTRRFRWILVGAPSLPFRKRSARSWNCRSCRLGGRFFLGSWWDCGWLDDSGRCLPCEKTGCFMIGWFIIMYY